MADKPRWPTIGEISESVGGPGVMDGIKNQAKSIANKLATWVFILLLVATYGAICHFSYPFVHKISYKKAKGYFELNHEEFLGEVMAETPNVCSDEHNTPVACYYLHKGSHGLISQATERHQ